MGEGLRTKRYTEEKTAETEFGDGLLDVCRAIAQASGRQVFCR
jgi:hypothetical protein